jgi:hypothetical protein
MLHPWTLDSSIVRGTIDPSDAMAAVRHGTAREHLDAALVNNLTRMLLIERWALLICYLSSTCESIVLQLCGMRVPSCWWLSFLASFASRDFCNTRCECMLCVGGVGASVHGCGYRGPGTVTFGAVGSARSLVPGWLIVEGW